MSPNSIYLLKHAVVKNGGCTLFSARLCLVAMYGWMSQFETGTASWNFQLHVHDRPRMSIHTNHFIYSSLVCYPLHTFVLPTTKYNRTWAVLTAGRKLGIASWLWSCNMSLVSGLGELKLLSEGSIITFCVFHLQMMSLVSITLYPCMHNNRPKGSSLLSVCGAGETKWNVYIVPIH